MAIAEDFQLSNTKHWTEKSHDSFSMAVAHNFVAQIEEHMERLNMSRKEFAKSAGVSKGYVSQLLNDPGNLTTRVMVACARALGLKVSILAYDDGDYNNEFGPIHPNIFNGCWERYGKPMDMWDLTESTQAAYRIENDLRDHGPVNQAADTADRHEIEDLGPYSTSKDKDIAYA